MKQILEKLTGHETLNRNEAYEVFGALSRGYFSDAQTAAFLSVYSMRSITIDELAGFRDALIGLSLAVDLPSGDATDMCGTGGDGKQTFNISTLASFVAAAAGVRVIKHGNYGVSSVSGSSNVMEYFGCRFTTENDQLLRQLDECGICFLHAPLFHPALRNVSAVRKNLGVRTIFNMLGPLINPAQPKFRVNGVFSAATGRMYQYLAQQSDQNCTVIYSLDGFDELSLTGEAKIFSNSGEQMFVPEENGFERIAASELLAGETKEDAAQLFYRIISGKGTKAQNAVVAANAALAIRQKAITGNYTDAVNIALETLQSGKAKNTFEKFIQLN